MAIDEPIQRGTLAGDFQPAKTKIGQKMSLVHQRLSLPDSGSRHIDYGDGDFKLTDELDIVVGQQSKAVDDCPDPDAKVDYDPLRSMRPHSVVQGAKKTSTCFSITYKRRRGKPARSESNKRNIEQKPVLVHTSKCSGSKSDKGDDLEPGYKDGNFELSEKADDPEPSDNYANFKSSDMDDDFEPTRKRRRTAASKSSKSKKPLWLDTSTTGYFEPEVPDDDGQKKCASVNNFYGTAMDRAVKLDENFPAEGPSFIKLMLKSHVVSGFWLGLPVRFCRNHLPDHDVKIVLEDEDVNSYHTNYLAQKEGLSGGWRAFAVHHDLKVGDVTVFQFVEQTRFKVYILRENRFSTTDGALSLLCLDTSKENRPGGCSSDDDVASEEATDDGIRSPDPDTDFSTVKNLRNFKIIIEGSAIERKLFPARMRKPYYELCFARKAFLHRHLLKGINPTLAAGVIVETVSIAEGIMASHAHSSSFEEDLAAWKKTLKSLELLGMDIAFLYKRVEDLLALLTAQPPPRDLHLVALEDCEGYEKVKQERDSVAAKMRALGWKMSSLNDALKEMDIEMKDMDMQMKEMDMEMKEMVDSSARKKKDQAVRRLADAPW